MNKLERDILEILSEDSRTDAVQIAVMLGEREETVREAVRAMEKRGAIVKYTAIANLDEEEDECVEALIEVKIAPRSGSGFDGVAEELAQHKEVKTLYLMSGAYDLLVIVEAGSIKSVSRFVSECISTFDCVLSTATHFILKKYKIEGALTVGRDKKRRLPVQA
ncbi:MAG: Lrp/AsnC family transcriptional regulator [Clostridiales bacterium]|nr:Lrp/AsnC family transcriptional regulator [Clostridiales bacterium]